MICTDLLIDVRTWVKLEKLAKKEGKTPEEVASSFLERKVGVTEGEK
jgi:hypothetical protein